MVSKPPGENLNEADGRKLKNILPKHEGAAPETLEETGGEVISLLLPGSTACRPLYSLPLTVQTNAGHPGVLRRDLQPLCYRTAPPMAVRHR